MTEYVRLNEILERPDPRVTNEDFDQNAQASYEREEAALEAALNAVSKLWPANNSEEMLSLSARVGHFAKRTDNTSIYILTALPPTSAGNWAFFCKYTSTEVAPVEVVDSLVSTASDKALSANQGRVLKLLLDDVLSSTRFKGTWNAEADLVTDGGVGAVALPEASEDNKGWYYVVDTEGDTEVDGVNEWSVGDWIISVGTSWVKIDNTDAVVTVNGQRGIVVLNASHIDETVSRKYVTAEEKELINTLVVNADDLETPSFNDFRGNRKFIGSNIFGVSENPLVYSEIEELGPKNSFVCLVDEHEHLVVQTVFVTVDNTLSVAFQKYRRFGTDHYETGVVFGSWAVI